MSLEKTNQGYFFNDAYVAVNKTVYDLTTLFASKYPDDIGVL